MHMTIVRKKVNDTGASGAGRAKDPAVFFAGLLCLCFVLCGCTRREQLLFETTDARRMEQSETLVEQEDEGGRGMAVSPGDTSGQSRDQDEPDQAVLQESRQPADTNQPQEVQTICVHVCGAVKNPGVYELSGDSRVYEAVEKAGGFSEDADQNYVNQAQQLADGLKLVIPTMKETEETAGQEGTAGQIGIIGPGREPQSQVQRETAGGNVSPEASGDAGDGSPTDGRININTASMEELCTIPGIGSTRAAAIIAYRQDTGGFASVEDIMNVSGIKEGTYAKIKDSIKVN